MTVHRHRGPVDAVMTVERRRSSFGAIDSRRLHLTVKVGGQTILDRNLCTPSRCGLGTQQELSLKNVWGDGVPEPVLDYYSGGAHCCFATLVVLPDGRHPGRVVTHLWGDPGYSVKSHDGTPELVSADDRFAYEFTSFAASGLPVQVWTISPGGVFTDATRTRLDLVAADARQWWRAYTSERGKADSDVRGVVGAWCADEYRLGRRSACNAELAAALAHGWLKGVPDWPENAGFVSLLHKQLAAWGYPGR